MTRFHFIVGLFTAWAGLTLQAQTIRLQGNVPFDFRMGNAVMPAGDYQFKSTGTALVAQEGSGSGAAVILTHAAERTTPPTAGELEFHRYGDTYFLARIWTTGSREGRQAPMTAREREFARRNSPITLTVAAVQRK